MSRLHQFICAHWPWLSRQCGPPAEYMPVTNSSTPDAWPYVDRRRVEGRPPPGMPERRHREADVVREYEGLTKEVRTTLRALDTMIDVMTAGAASAARIGAGHQQQRNRPHGGGKRV